MLPITSPATAPSATSAHSAPEIAGNPAFSLLLQLSVKPDVGATDLPRSEIPFDPAALVGLSDDLPTEIKGGKAGKSGKDLPDHLPDGLPVSAAVTQDTAEIAIAALQVPATPVPAGAVAEPRAAPEQQGNLPANATPAPVPTSRIAALQLALRNTLANSPAAIAAPQVSVQGKGPGHSAVEVTLPSAAPVMMSEHIAQLSGSLAKPIPAPVLATSAPATRQASSDAAAGARSTLDTLKAAPTEAAAPAASRASAAAHDGDKAPAAEPVMPTTPPERARSAEPVSARADARPAVDAIQITASAEPVISAPEPRNGPATTTSAAAPIQVRATGETPHDFNTLVDRLTEARDAALPHVVRTALRNDDFGVVNLQFRMESDRLSVSMNSADPDFAPTVSAASAGAQTGSGDTANQNTARQETATGSQAQAGPGQGGARQNDQAQSQQAAERQSGQRAGRGTAADSSASDAASPKSTDRRNSIYA